ncbi:MAG: enoyl-CoA hydratase-related protein [Candidatus Hydrogenedentes bacterium]|nr:enoyl-CoA hydratase-related protein [Candidatus Hydrogenedentota bacterium]
MSENSNVLFEKKRDVGILTLNRPERLNALSGGIVEGSLDIIGELSRDRSVRALIITGAGRGFCAGADIKSDGLLKSGESGSGSDSVSLGEAVKGGVNKLIMAICDAPFPVVSAVNGPAAGAGVGIALAPDFLVASESMRLLLTFSRIGMGLDGGTSWFLAHLLGQKRAAAISMLVEPIDAQRAMEWGIAWSVASDENLMAEAISLATRLSEGATLAYAAQKKQLRTALSMTLQEALEHEADVQDVLVRSDDLREGIMAFREGRPGNYTGT